MPLYITFIKIEHSMNICNKYFKIVINKETTNIHSGVQIPTVSKRKSGEEHSALEFHDTVAGCSTRLTIVCLAAQHTSGAPAAPLCKSWTQAVLYFLTSLNTTKSLRFKMFTTISSFLETTWAGCSVVQCLLSHVPIVMVCALGQE